MDNNVLYLGARHSKSLGVPTSAPTNEPEPSMGPWHRALTSLEEGHGEGVDWDEYQSRLAYVSFIDELTDHLARQRAIHQAYIDTCAKEWDL